MIVPVFEYSKITEDNGSLTRQWSLLIENLLQNMQSAIGPNGFQIPTVSSAATSIEPSAFGGELAKIASTFGEQGGIIAGTIIYDPAVAPNGALKVVLNDGTIHIIQTL